MISDRYGVVNEAQRNAFEKKYQLPFGYEMATFDYRKAENACRRLGEGFVVEKISTDMNFKSIIYRATAN